MPTLSTYDIIGRAEDVSDVITILTPTKTPFQSSIGSEKVTARNFDWQEDSLRAVQTNAQVEGFDATDDTLSGGTLRTNYTQILQKTFKVSTTTDVIKKYGRATETAYQLSKAASELKRDLENAMVGVTQAAVAGNSSTARQMASALNQVAAGTTVTNSSTALTETNVLTVAQNCYNNGAEPSILMVKPADALIVANFAAISNQRIRDYGENTKVVNKVDVYVSPFGELKVVLNRFIKTTHALVYDPDMWKQCVLRPWTRTLLAKVGDADRHMLVGEYSLKHLNQLASGLVAGLT